MNKVSIIVPVYNTSTYLIKCLDSLINQDYDKKKYEIIIVNDGSTDNSEEIILKYKNKFPNIIKYFKKENGGLSSARNLGIMNAKYEYILFVDSDDYVDQNLLSIFGKYNKSYDLFVYGYNEVYENNDKNICRSISENMIIKRDESIKMFIENSSVRGYVWNKIFKKSIIYEKKLLFDEKIRYIEDLPFLFEYLEYCNEIFFSSEVLYNYVQRSGSLINSGFNKSKLTALIAYDSVAKKIIDFNKNYLPTFYYFVFELNYELSVRIKISKDYASFVKDYKKLKRNMKEYFLKFIFKKVKLKYKLKASIKYFLYNFILLRYEVRK